MYISRFVLLVLVVAVLALSGAVVALSSARDTAVAIEPTCSGFDCGGGFR